MQRLLLQIYKALPISLKRVVVFLLNPKFTVGFAACIFRGQKLLLLRQSYEDGWSFPGGMVKSGESFNATVEREIKEELNIGSKIQQILLVKNIPKNRKINIFVKCIIDDREKIQVDGIEIVEARFFHINELPSDIIPAHRGYVDYLVGKDK